MRPQNPGIFRCITVGHYPCDLALPILLEYIILPGHASVLRLRQSVGEGFHPFLPPGFFLQICLLIENQEQKYGRTQGERDEYCQLGCDRHMMHTIG